MWKFKEKLIENNVEIINGTFNVYDIDVEDLDVMSLGSTAKE